MKELERASRKAGMPAGVRGMLPAKLGECVRECFYRTGGDGERFSNCKVLSQRLRGHQKIRGVS